MWLACSRSSACAAGSDRTDKQVVQAGFQSIKKGNEHLACIKFYANSGKTQHGEQQQCMGYAIVVYAQLVFKGKVLFSNTNSASAASCS